MSHLGRPGTCHLCGEDLALATSELDIIEGFKLTLVDVTRTDEDDLEDQEEEFTEPEDLELLGTFCDVCAQKVKFGIERWLMGRIQAKQKIADAVNKDSDDAPAE